VKSARAAVVILLAAGAACAEAGGDPTGGQLTPAGQLAVTPPVFAPPAIDAGNECGTGSKWSELYRDIFGSGKAGSCTFAANCHGTPTGDGALSASAIKCFDEAGCRQSIIDQFLARPSNAENPTGSPLIKGILRARTASGTLRGIMPREPADYVFPQACLDRISGWIANGVPAD